MTASRLTRLWYAARGYRVCCIYRGADKSLARPGRKQANVSVRVAWISFGALPCRGGKKTWWYLTSRCCWNRARPWHDCELVSFLFGLRTYQHPGRSLPPHSGIINMVMLVVSISSPPKPHGVPSHKIATQCTFNHHHRQQPQICVISGFYSCVNEIVVFLGVTQVKLVVTDVSGKPFTLQIGRCICYIPPAVYSFLSFLSVTTCTFVYVTKRPKGTAAAICLVEGNRFL